MQPVRTYACLAASLFVLFQSIERKAMAGQPMFSRPIAIAVSADRGSVFIGNQNSSSIVVLDMQTQTTRQVRSHGSGLTDLVCSPNSDWLLATTSSPSQIQEVDAATNPLEQTRSASLPGIPSKLAISLDGRFACVSMTWNHAIGILELKDGRLSVDSELKLLSLEFQPQEVLALENGLFLVADAFGGQLAVVDAKTAKAIASHKVNGHHIGGLARDDSMGTIAITHQRLSAVAHTNRDDIHWGTLMQNIVTAIPEAQLIDPKANFDKSTVRWMVGKVGNGASDPSGIAAWDGRVFVAVTGTNQIAWRDKSSGRFQYHAVEQSPTRLARLSENRLLWISLLGDTANMMELDGDRLMTLASFGTPRVLASPEERGEAAFFSGRLSHDGWMSCSSCHINGHSPDLLADTKGDGRHDTPKRIPSLFNVASTGPWTWNGSEPTLAGQIAKTLSTTMHRDTNAMQAVDDDVKVANDIAAYLETLRSPRVEIANPVERKRGQDLFEMRGCTRCHQPSLHYTSRDAYDVGVFDEAGQNKFNPPSMVGIAHRKAFLHDGRYKELGELLRSHPDTSVEWTTEEIASLSQFLASL